MTFKMFTFIISAFRNRVAKYHLHSLHRSREINNNVLKIDLLDLQTVHCLNSTKLEQLQSSLAETVSGFFCSLQFSVERISFHMYFIHYFLFNSKLLLASWCLLNTM